MVGFNTGILLLPPRNQRYLTAISPTIKRRLVVKEAPFGMKRKDVLDLENTGCIKMLLSI
jgi:hypothetical protein